MVLVQSVESLKRPVKVDINEIKNVWQGSTNVGDKTMSGTLCEQTIVIIGVRLAGLTYPISIIWEVKVVVISDDYNRYRPMSGTYTEKGTPKTVAFDCLGNRSTVLCLTDDD